MGWLGISEQFIRRLRSRRPLPHGYCRRLEPRRQVFSPQTFAQGGEHEMVESLRIAKTHLYFRRVDVDVDLIRRQLQKKKGDGVPTRHEQAAIGLLHRVS